MIAKAAYIVFHLFGDIVEIFLVGREHSAGKSHILPDHYSEAVADIIEVLAFIKSTSPYAEHIHVASSGIGYKSVVVRPVLSVREIVDRNPVRTFAEHVCSVKTYGETSSAAVIFPDDFSCSDSGLLCE